MTVFILALLISTLPTAVINAAVEFCFPVIVQTPSSTYRTKKWHKDFTVFSMRLFYCADTVLIVFCLRERHSNLSASNVTG